MANENRRGERGRGGRGSVDRGRGGGRGGFGGPDRDRSPVRDDPYGDPYRAGGPRLPPPYPPPGGEYGMRDPYFPDPYRRYPEPWLPPDDPYRRDPYADPYRDPYGYRAAPPPPVECEIFITSSQLRSYGDAIERRVKEHNIITAVSVLPEGRTAPQMVEDLTAQNALFAIFINPQNEMHRSLTLNILHGTPQEHRNMPLDDAIALVGRSFVKYVEGLREKANAAAAPLPSTRVFLPASPEVAYLLNLLADNRAVTVTELNTVIKYLQERRDKLLDAESRPVITEDGILKSPSSQKSPGQEISTNEKGMTATQQDLTNKILSIFSSAGGTVQGVPPANGTTTQQPPKPPSGTPAPPPPPPATVPSSASLINFDNPNVQKALDNLIQSTPNLLKNINTKTSVSSAQMGVQSVSTSLGALGGHGYSSQGQGQSNLSPGQGYGGYGSMQGVAPGQQGGPRQGGMQAPGPQSGYDMQAGQMGRGYGQSRY